MRTLACGRFIAGLATVLLLSACAPSIMPIKSLLDDPSRFNGKTVRATGKVTHSAGALGVGGYQINDGTGTLTVVSSKGDGAPREGADIGVQGKFRAVGVLGSRSAAVLEESKRFTP